jgi:molybdopterin-binding protein
MKTSARNQFAGTITSVEKGAVGAVVKLKTGTPCEITAFITKEAVEDLKLKKGDAVVAIIKSTEVMVGKND